MPGRPHGRPNLWGTVPSVVEMQSEGGAAGAVHGALQGGGLATTFTASQGLLLMIPNMFKIAGELTPAVFHVTARAVATHALSIFGDHSDVMAVRSTGFAMLSSASVQEAQDLAVVAHAAALESRCRSCISLTGSGRRTSSRRSRRSTTRTLRAMIDDRPGRGPSRAGAHTGSSGRSAARRRTPMCSSRTAKRSTAIYDRGTVDRAATMDQLRRAHRTRGTGCSSITARPDAERVIVVMGSAHRDRPRDGRRPRAAARGRRARPSTCIRPVQRVDFLAALPATARQIAVLDRTKEPGAIGEPLYQDVMTALAEVRYGRQSTAVAPTALTS